MKRLLQIDGEGEVHLLSGDIGIVRSRRDGGSGVDQPRAWLAFPVAEHPSPAILDRLAHEFELREELDGSWALLPLELKRVRGSTVMMLEDPGGEFLAGRVGAPMAMGLFLPLAVGIATALGNVHRRGLIHKDVKPANIVVGSPDGRVRLTGFGSASRLLRERQAPEAPETIGGTLAYMAPEQTGRTERSVDARSDLYALGVTFYQMLTGGLPFTATDPMEWVHCHIARIPLSPSSRTETVPEPISALVMKLLAKTPEDRYQTAAGLEHDLRRCMDEWGASSRIGAFDLGSHDAPARPLVPERLYGREAELETVLGCFNRVTRTGGSELLMVSGYAGIGKSALVNELFKTLVPARSLFASGKFDQQLRDVPYGPFIQALQDLVRPLLSKSEADLAEWRSMFLQALGANGRLITDIIPEMALVIGDQPPAAELPLQQAQVRFQAVFQRFIGVFARPEHPLTLFLDDLQWVDLATLDLLEEILTRSEGANLLLVGAYRDNEVATDHPLMKKLDVIKSAGGAVTEVLMGPISRDDLTAMIAAALSSREEDTRALADLVYDKTGGNPFFVTAFLSMLVESRMLAFDHDRSRWTWDVASIAAQQYTDNVADLMVGGLVRLPGDTQAALRELSCIGNAADMATLALVVGVDAARVDAVLLPARRLDLVQRTSNGYRFSHDRVQEAAYSLLPEGARAESHLRIGRLMMRQADEEDPGEAIFDIVNQLNRGATLISLSGEREELAALNLVAGERARSSAAYASALNYFSAGAALLTEQVWESRGELAFALAHHVAECEFLTGGPMRANELLAALHSRVSSVRHSSAVARLRGEIFLALNQPEQAVGVGLDYLRRIGTNWSDHPTIEEVEKEYSQLVARLGSFPIESLGELPPMTDPGANATMEVLLQLAPAAVSTDANLLCLIACRMANLSLDHGDNDGSCAAYVWLGMVLGPYLGDYQSGSRFGSLGLELVERPGLERFRVRAYMLFGAHVNPWAQHVRQGGPMLQRAFDEANRVGDVIFAGFSCCNLNTILLGAGDDLESVQREVEFGLGYARDHQFSFVIDLMTPQLQLIRTLRGTLSEFGSFDGQEFSERGFELRIKALPVAACFYWVRKLQARFLAGRYAEAIEAASEAEPLLWTSMASFERVEYHFYTALARAAMHDGCDDAGRGVHMEAVTAHHRQLLKWAENCPVNFEDSAALIGAEIARLEGRALDAMHLYERAIRVAEDHGFAHHHALANELAARFHLDRGFETIARAYLREAREGYLRWGAVGKVQQIDGLQPYARDPRQTSAAIGTSTSLVESLDLATVIKVSQAIAGETALNRLVDTLMRTAMEHAGGEKAVLLLMDNETYRVEAHALIDAEGVAVHSRRDAPLETPVPGSVLRYVARVRESVILDDASAQNAFSDDPYFESNEVRSLLCLPLISRTQLLGLLYIENNLAPRVFTSGRLAVLKLIALQAAISLENTRLYRDIEERESKIRRLVESDVIGIVIWDLDGNLIEANDAFLSMLQCDRSDLAAGLRWFDMTPPEWQDVHIEAEAEELRTTGAMRAREKEYFRKDGSRVPVLIGAAAFESQPDQGVAYILDLTDLKRAEAEARDNERRYREAQMELAHANRTSTLGQLTGSIAHEVNQPITATVTNAQAGLREMRGGSPDLAEVEDALESIAKDGIRAGEIIARIRGLIKKSPAIEEVLAINDPVREVIELTRSEAEKNSIAVRAELSTGLPSVRADKVQIQQVLLNLIVNAVEAMSIDSISERELVVSTGLNGAGEVLVGVRDLGPGLEPSAEENAFEAFYTTKASGLGMGLSICRSILESHGGRIWVTPNDPHGAFFQFTLPTDGSDPLNLSDASPVR